MIWHGAGTETLMICVMRVRQQRQLDLFDFLNFLAHSSQNAWWPHGTITCVADAFRHDMQFPTAAASSVTLASKSKAWSSDWEPGHGAT
mmetsp:Transcript_128970/g.223785  ORF Transcript_128970/g.223785 Transcript_128970/m.223785 type:complete len:89 (+) Transcript_128970:202-468(+)